MVELEARARLLETLRLARGLTQVELAEKARIPQATLSKVESASMELDAQRWSAIAESLQVPVSAFENARAVKPARIFHRKQRTTPKSDLRMIGANAALVQQRVSDVVGEIVAPSPALAHRDLEDGFVTPQEVAQEVRQAFGLGDGPITDLTAVVETAGALVLRWSLDSLQVDAIATWTEDELPVILLGEHAPAERQRFTLAHELGHAVMHRDGDEEPTEAREREADAFAAEFLLPRARLGEEWPADPTVETLLPVKKRWGVSLSALIRRAADCGLLDERQYRDWNIRLSTSGLHRREPDPIPPEHPRALTNAIQSVLDAGTSLEELADRAHMYPTEFVYTFLEQDS